MKKATYKAEYMSGLLKSVMSEKFVQYRGCLIERVPNGYSRGGIVYASLAEAQKAIDNTFEKWAKTITK